MNVRIGVDTILLVDEEKKMLTELYHRGGVAVKGRSENATGWVADYDGLAKSRLSNKKLIENLQNGPIGSRTPSSSPNRYQHAAMPTAEHTIASSTETRAMDTSSTTLMRPSVM